MSQNPDFTYCNIKEPVDEDKISIKNNNFETNISPEDAHSILRAIRIKNVNRLMIGSLNINSLANKFDLLREIISNHLDILVIVETKLDKSFPTNQFLIPGYNKPYRLDRNRNGGGVMIYVKENVPSKSINKHNFAKKVEGLFIEINLRKSKLLLLGAYHSTHPEFGLSDEDFFEQISLALDVYSNYDKYLLAGDFNIEENESCLSNFLYGTQ